MSERVYAKPNTLNIIRSFSSGYLMRSRLLSSAAGVLLTLAFWSDVQAQSKRIVSLNTLARQQVMLENIRVVPPKTPVSAPSKPAKLTRMLNAYVSVFRTDPDPFVQTAISLYEQTGGALIWYRSQGWIAAADDAYRILDQARFDGLPSEKYLGKITQSPSKLQTRTDIVEADFALTLGLLRFALDLKFGLGHEISPGTLDEAFKAAYSANQLDAWIDGFRPETPLYLRLHQALLLGELTPLQQDKAALTLHREREPFLIHPERHIVVDLGLQQLTVYEDRREVMTMPVVVGKPDRRTPLMSDKIVNLKFSPDWSVPPVIAREDILPILRDDPALIELMGVRVLDSDGVVVDAQSVDWAEIDPYAIPYKFHMLPGIDNLLGGVRFSLTNDQAIFLHDSPERDRFGDGVRTFSSGCVRVGDSATLAAWIMGRQKNWKRTDVIAAMVSGKTRIEVLPDEIPVDLVYSTVGLTADDGLVFMPDIYGEDAKLAASIGMKVNDVPPPLPKARETLAMRQGPEPQERFPR